MGDIVYKYRGNGAYIMDVPARDLTQDDVDALTEEQRQSLVDHVDSVKNSIYRFKGASTDSPVETSAADTTASSTTTTV